MPLALGISGSRLWAIDAGRLTLRLFPVTPLAMPAFNRGSIPLGIAPSVASLIPPVVAATNPPTGEPPRAEEIAALANGLVTVVELRGPRPSAPAALAPAAPRAPVAPLVRIPVAILCRSIPCIGSFPATRLPAILPSAFFPALDAICSGLKFPM